MAFLDLSEKTVSQYPALAELMNLGYEYLSHEAVRQERGKKYSNVLLENILREKLKQLNSIQTLDGRQHSFSEANIETAIQKLKAVDDAQGLLRASEKVYELLTLGTSLEQTIDEDKKSHTLKFIDWENPSRNAFHITDEFSVERMGRSSTKRPDIVLFVNGIPLTAIECKAPDVPVNDAISQLINYQNWENIPHFFKYVQMLIATNKNEVKYGTVGTKSEFWSVWQEDGLDEDEVEQAIKRLPKEIRSRIQSQKLTEAQNDSGQKRIITNQDRMLYALCRPERLLGISRNFTLYDGSTKKIARHQQFFVVHNALEQIKQLDNYGARKGGMIWHTQGSGKSLTMVWLLNALMNDPEIKNPRIIAVTDRQNLDRQIEGVFDSCDLEPKRATSGKNLMKLIGQKHPAITTIIHKFKTALSLDIAPDDDPNIFVMVDESHRTQFGILAQQMRRILPNACFIGFTGTPLTKEDKNNFALFGELIQPSYTVRKAIEDGAVVPLFYENRSQLELHQNDIEIDKEFERKTAGFTEEERARLKKKYASVSKLNETDQVVYRRALDIHTHYRTDWQGKGLKAQLVTPSKSAAVKYHKYLQEIGGVSSAVIISAPDMREGDEQDGDEYSKDVQSFWKEMMEEYGTEGKYNDQITRNFKNPDGRPEILIVVDKLLTGFDAPVNTVLYLCRRFNQGHTLLQAIARVNRVYPGKDNGFVMDYCGNLEELNKALAHYDLLAGYDQNDLEGTITSIDQVVGNLPIAHLELLDIFKDIKNRDDSEEYELLLADDEKRLDFISNETKFAKDFSVACSSAKFLRDTDDKTFEEYRKDLKKFERLRGAVRQRYAAEEIDYKEYEPIMKNLLNTYIYADKILVSDPPTEIFGANANAKNLSDAECGARADSLAHHLKKEIHENMKKDPTFYEKFSELIKEAIEKFHQGRLPGMEDAGKISGRKYLEEVEGIIARFENHDFENVPESLRGDEKALAFHGTIMKLLEGGGLDSDLSKACSLEIAKRISEILNNRHKVNFWDDSDAQNRAERDILDYFYDELDVKWGIRDDSDLQEEIISQTMEIAKNWAIRSEDSTS